MSPRFKKFNTADVYILSDFSTYKDFKTIRHINEGI